VVRPMVDADDIIALDRLPGWLQRDEITPTK
jgi:hypothetical protein